jgi:hypothetical protein
MALRLQYKLEIFILLTSYGEGDCSLHHILNPNIMNYTKSIFIILLPFISYFLYAQNTFEFNYASEKAESPNIVYQDTDENYIIGGSEKDAIDNNYNIFLLKLNEEGELINEFVTDDSLTTNETSVNMFEINNNYYLIGLATTLDTIHYFTYRVFDKGFNLLTEKYNKIKEGGRVTFWDVILDSDSNFVVSAMSLEPYGSGVDSCYTPLYYKTDINGDSISSKIWYNNFSFPFSIGETKDQQNYLASMQDSEGNIVLMSKNFDSLTYYPLNSITNIFSPTYINDTTIMILGNQDQGVGADFN